MRLDFNVLWVEDQQPAVKAQCDRIERLIKREGFRLQVIYASSVKEANTYLSQDIYGDHIDLILMDFDLGAGGRGDQGLVEVRNIFPYKDIVFYSAKAQDLQRMVTQKRVEGVFCSTRNDLPDTVDGLFEALVKKVLDIDHSRGIVMGATSDIDHHVNDCLTSRFDGSNEELQAGALKVVERHAKEKRKRFEKDIRNIETVKHVSELQDFHNVYTSSDRLRLLKNMLNGDKSHEEKVTSITNYLSDTVPRRNELAHVRVKVDGFSRKLFDREGNELTCDQMKSLRKELLGYQDFFEELSLELNASSTRAK